MEARDVSSPGHVVLSDFQPVVLQRPVRQEVLLSYKAWLLGVARCAEQRTESAEAAEQIAAQARSAVQQFGVSPHHIARRQFNALPESEERLGASAEGPELPTWFADCAENPAGPALDRRMAEHAALAGLVFRRWYAERAAAPDHLIHVTCSGYASPSPAQQLVSDRGWLSTNVTHCYHMGCYAAFPAIRMAIGLLAPSILSAAACSERVDIVHTEYLSVHFDPLEQSPGQIIDSTLFADGFIGYSAYPEQRWGSSRRRGLKLLAQHEELLPDSLDAMTWTIGQRHFEMQLSKSVPLSIRAGLPGFLKRLCAKAGCDFDRSKAGFEFALHPGGPKILDHARDALGIDERQLRHARGIFRTLGNMSSATVPHIFLQLCADPAVPVGQRIIAAAFGPGLTATALLLEKV